MSIRSIQCPRILALKPKGLVLPSIHSSMVRAFRILGADVLDIPVPDNPGDIFQLFRRASRPFDAGFILDMGVDSAFIRNFRETQVTVKIPWIIWFVDDPEGYGFPGSCDPKWTYAFCWDRQIARCLSRDANWKGRPMIHLPLAADPEIFSPGNPSPDLLYKGGVFVGSTRHKNDFLEKAAASIPGIQQAEDKIWENYSRDLTQPLNDVLWEYLAEEVGKAKESIHQDPLAKVWILALAFRLGRRKRAEAALHLLDGGAVFGDEGWREILPTHYKGGLFYGKKVRAVYNASSFILDVRQTQARTGLTQRVFDAGCCGVPVLAEWSPELEILFDPGRELFTYQTIEEGIRKRVGLLRSSSDSLRKAEKLRRRILGEHTYLHRTKLILEALGGKSP